MPIKIRRISTASVALGLFTGLTLQVNAEEEEKTRPPMELVVVTATRMEQPINEVARTVIVLDQEIIDRELAKSSNIANLLGDQVPGFGAPSHIDQLRTQTLRGRDPLYLIDGIPLAFNSGGGFLQGPLVKFDSGTVRRVEVLYGPTALYGAGATGGVIQFFTHQAPPDDVFQFNIRQFFNFYPGADDPLGNDSLSWLTALRFAGTVKKFDYVASISYDSQNGVFDGNGDLANPVYYGYTDDTSYFLKLGFNPTENQRIELIYSLVDRQFDERNYASEITDDGFAIGVEAEEDLSFTYSGSNRPKDEKTLYSLSYQHGDLLGGQLRLQYYGRKDEIVEPLADLGFSLPPWPDNYQNYKTDESYGVRAQFSRSFVDRFTLLVGADYEEQKREASALVYDLGERTPQDRILGEPVREGLFIYPFTLDTLGLFVQMEWEVTDRLRLSGGLRHERAEFEIGPGVRLFDREQANRQGGSGEDSGNAYNIGLTFDIIEQLTFYTNYAQGFEIPSLSQVSTVVPPDEPLESNEAIKPQIVDNYEIGFRGMTTRFTYGLAVYYAESDFGQNFLYDPATGLGRYNRSPEKTYGFELVGGWQATDKFYLNSSFSWTEGEYDPADDDSDEFVAQSGLDIQPWKFILNGRYDITRRLNFNFQALVVGDRDSAFKDGTDLWEAEGYDVYDMGMDYLIGRHRVSMQVTNVFNKAYLTPSSQSYTGNPVFAPRVAGAPGRAVSLTYEGTF